MIYKISKLNCRHSICVNLNLIFYLTVLNFSDAKLPTSVKQALSRKATSRKAASRDDRASRANQLGATRAGRNQISLLCFNTFFYNTF